jgi:hypothetical protein
MTQLNLSGRQPGSQQQAKAEPDEETIKNQTVGALGALAMFAAVIVVASCSRSNKPVARQSMQPAAPVSAPAPVAPGTVQAPAVVNAKAKPAKKRRAATLSYVNTRYGVSFNFPRTYKLKTGRDLEVTSGVLEPSTNFVFPGGETLAALQLAANSYPGTDFRSALVSLSVNPNLTAETCSQFAYPQSGAESAASTPAKVEQVKVGKLEFQEVENNGPATMNPAKYYHAFSNGMCYEFALGIGIDENHGAEEITPVDRTAVFAKLETILASVKLAPVVTPETAAPAADVAAATPGNASNTLPSTQQNGATPPNF